MAQRRMLLRFYGTGREISAMLICSLTCAFFLAWPAHALDPDLRLSQYMHKSWRIQDGSVSAGMFSVAQTSDGFLWLTSVAQAMYRFDGIRFVPWTLRLDGRTLDHVVSVHADRAGGLWAIAEHEIFHMKGGVVTAHFALEGQFRTGNISEDSDGALWSLQAGPAVHAPLCRVTEHHVKCFGESEGIPLPTGGQALLADVQGGFWLGGQRAVVHWREDVSHVYPIEALKTNSGDGVTVGTRSGHRARVFDAFYTTKAEGLGIGLSISRSIVEAHGGQLAAAPNEPHGAVFRFSIPVAEGGQS